MYEPADGPCYSPGGQGCNSFLIESQLCANGRLSLGCHPERSVSEVEWIWPRMKGHQCIAHRFQARLCRGICRARVGWRLAPPQCPIICVCSACFSAHTGVDCSLPRHMYDTWDLPASVVVVPDAVRNPVAFLPYRQDWETFNCRETGKQEQRQSSVPRKRAIHVCQEVER